MRTWSRSPGYFVCGYCMETYPTGSPMLSIVIAVGARATKRCTRCADEPVPENLPALVPRETPDPVPVPVRQIRGLPLDWKQVQAGDREPGEEG